MVPSSVESGLSRVISLRPEPCTRVALLYSDAEGYGGLGAVAVLPDGGAHYLHGKVPRSVVRRLKPRKTQIVAYELFAALVALVSLCPSMIRTCRVVHFIDSSAALACVVRGFSREADLADIAGRLWFEALGLGIQYEVYYVPTKSNLADGPSRGDMTLMRSLNAKECRSWSLPSFSAGLGDWIAHSSQVHRMVM